MKPSAWQWLSAFLGDLMEALWVLFSDMFRVAWESRE